MPRTKKRGRNALNVEDENANQSTHNLRRSTRHAAVEKVEANVKETTKTGDGIGTDLNGKKLDEETLAEEAENDARPSKKRRKTVEKAPKSTEDQSTKTKQKTKNKTETKETSNEHHESESSYWLLKAEPESRLEKGIDVKFSIDDLEACTKPEPWEGVRNHVAKKNMMAMKRGDLGFFYHSNTKIPGIAGILEVVEESSPDQSAFDPKHPYYDPKSDPENPRWFHVHVGFKRKFLRLITLKELQSYKGSGTALEDMQLLKQSRLSVSKVSAGEWAFIMDLAEKETSDEGK